jgi:hypothetical protein
LPPLHIDKKIKMQIDKNFPAAAGLFLQTAWVKNIVQLTFVKIHLK